MSLVYFTSDLHIGHANICNFRKRFTSVQEHEEYFADLWDSTIRKRDTVYLLGDILFTEDSFSWLRKRRGNKVLVLGNHDFQHVDNNFVRNNIFNTVCSVHGVRVRKGMWLTHAPIHYSELRGRPNVHGHTHGNFKPPVDQANAYFSVCPEDNDYNFVTQEELMAWRDTVNLR